MHLIVNEVCEDDSADTGGQFADDDGNEIIRIEGNGKRQMSRKDECTGNGERHIENGAFFVHFFNHADRSYVGGKTGDQTHGGNIVDADQLAEEDQRLFQNFGKNVNKWKCACHNNTSIDDGFHTFVIKGSHSFEQRDSGQFGEYTECKADCDKNLNAFTENGKDFDTAVGGKSKTCGNQTGENNQRDEVRRKICKAHLQNESRNQTADGDGDDTAEHTECYVFVTAFVNDAERKRNGEGNRGTEHGGNDKSVEISRSGVAGNLFRKRSTAHVVGEKRTHNDGRFQMQIFFQGLEYGHDPSRDYGGKNDHTDHGKCHGTEKHNAFFHLFANTETVADHTVNGGEQHEAGKNKV